MDKLLKIIEEVLLGKLNNNPSCDAINLAIEFLKIKILFKKEINSEE